MASSPGYRGAAPRSDGRETLPLGRLVNADGVLGQYWESVSGGILSKANAGERGLDASFARMIEGYAGTTHIGVRMRDGDITVITVENPEETDNAKRVYKLTNTGMNRNRATPSDPLRAITLTPDMVSELTVTTNEPMRVRTQVGTLQSNSPVVEIVSWNSSVACPPNTNFPPTTIRRDFITAVGGSLASLHP